MLKKKRTLQAGLNGLRTFRSGQRVSHVSEVKRGRTENPVSPSPSSQRRSASCRCTRTGVSSAYASSHSRRAALQPRAAAPTPRRCPPESLQIDRLRRSGVASGKACEFLVRQPGAPAGGGQQRSQRGPPFRQKPFPPGWRAPRPRCCGPAGRPAHAGRDAPRRAWGSMTGADRHPRNNALP